MAEESADLKKAASAKAHLGVMNEAHKAFHTKCSKIQEGVAEHCAKLAQLHQARAAEVTDHFSKLHKILGTADEIPNLAEEKPEPVSPEKEGTPSVIKEAGPVDQKEEVKESAEEKAKEAEAAKTAMIDELKKSMRMEFDQLLKGVLVGIIGEEKAEIVLKEAAQPVAKATVGIGDRGAVVLGAGPIMRTMPVAKNADISSTGLETPLAKEEPADVSKALLGDSAEALRLMKGTKASEVPATLVGLVGGMGR